MILTFKPPDLPPTLNGDKGLLRIHWSKRGKIKEKFQWLIKDQKFPKIKGQVTVKIINYALQLMDWDNLAGRFKIIGDALVANKMLEDDSPEFIIDFTMAQVRVHKKVEVRIEFLIEPVD